MRHKESPHQRTLERSSAAAAVHERTASGLVRLSRLPGIPATITLRDLQADQLGSKYGEVVDSAELVVPIEDLRVAGRPRIEPVRLPLWL